MRWVLRRPFGPKCFSVTLPAVQTLALRWDARFARLPDCMHERFTEGFHCLKDQCSAQSLLSPLCPILGNRSGLRKGPWRPGTGNHKICMIHDYMYTRTTAAELRAHGECDGAGTPEREGVGSPDHKPLSTGGAHSQRGPLEP